MEHGQWTQSGLAAEAGLHHTFISKLLAGDRMPLKKNVVALAKALSLTDDERDRLIKAAGFAVKADQPEWLSDLEAVVDHPDMPVITRSMLVMTVEGLTEVGRACIGRNGTHE